jgi:hypothetical protein
MASGTGSGLLDLLLKQTDVSTSEPDSKPWNPQYKRLYHKDEYTLEDISCNDKKQNKVSNVSL